MTAAHETAFYLFPRKAIVLCMNTVSVDAASGSVVVWKLERLGQERIFPAHAVHLRYPIHNMEDAYVRMKAGQDEGVACNAIQHWAVTPALLARWREVAAVCFPS
jgi:hypothetical protein